MAEELIPPPTELSAQELKVLKPWPLLEDRVDRKTIYKAQEEIGELIVELGKLQIALARVEMQGLDDIDPKTGVHNQDRLQAEIADVRAGLKLIVKRFDLDREYIRRRTRSKAIGLGALHAKT